MLQVSFRKKLGGDDDDQSQRTFMLDVEFTAPGGVTILFGPSGSGKTTCLRAIAGIVTPDEGRIILDGCTYVDSASGVNLSIQNRRVGFVFQDYSLFPHLTAEQNVAYGIRAKGSKKGKRERARELLSLVEIGHAAHQFPRELSGGEGQRVALARALASDPAVMLLDEPLSAVDVKTRARLLAEVEAIHRRTGIPIVYVTHNMAEAVAIGTHIVILNQGQVARQGSPQEIMPMEGID